MYKQEAWGVGLESSSRGRKQGRSETAKREAGERVKAPSFPPSPGRGAALNQCVIAISGKVPFALNRADRGKKRQDRLCNLKNLCKNHKQQ